MMIHHAQQVYQPKNLEDDAIILRHKALEVKIIIKYTYLYIKFKDTKSYICLLPLDHFGSGLMPCSNTLLDLVLG